MLSGSVDADRAGIGEGSRGDHAEDLRGGRGVHEGERLGSGWRDAVASVLMARAAAAATAAAVVANIVLRMVIAFLGRSAGPRLWCARCRALVALDDAW